MRLHVHFQAGNIRVDEVVEGDTAEALTVKMQERVAQEAGILIGSVIKRMTPLQFAQEATRRYNVAAKDSAPLPASCACRCRSESIVRCRSIPCRGRPRNDSSARANGLPPVRPASSSSQDASSPEEP